MVNIDRLIDPSVNIETTKPNRTVSEILREFSYQIDHSEWPHERINRRNNVNKEVSPKVMGTEIPMAVW